MSDPTTLFLLGYPLAIFANFSTVFIQEYFKSYDTKRLSELFADSFFHSLETNKNHVDEIGKENIEKCIEFFRKDKAKLINIISVYINENNLSLSQLRASNTLEKIADHLCNEFKLGHINFCKSIIKDCFRNYEEAFFSEITTKEGLSYVIKYLEKLDRDFVKKSDIEELKDIINSNFSELNSIPPHLKSVNKLLKKELNNPVSENFSDNIIQNFNSLHKTIDKLTKDQYQIIHYLKYKKRVIISGCAGSGKTLLAVEKAIRLQKSGLKSLIVTYNPYLAQYIRKLVKPSSVQVFDFTNLIYSIIGKEPYATNEWHEGIEPMDTELDVAFNLINENNINFDAIIVDEGQDFKELWWLIIEEISSNSSEQILYIFHDDQQSLIPIKSTYPIQNSPFPMSKNCRNSGKIFEVVKKFHLDAPITSQFLKQFGEYKLTTFQNNKHQIALQEIISKIDEDYGIHNLKILTNESTSKGSLLNNLKLVSSKTFDWQKVVNSDLSFLRNRALGQIKKLIKKKKFVLHGFSTLEEIENYFKVPSLSSELVPNNEDIDSVVSFANIISPFIKANKKQNKKINLLTSSGNKYLRPIKNINIHKSVLKIKMYLSRSWAKKLLKYEIITISSNINKVNLQKNIIPLNTVDLFKGLETDILILFINHINKDIMKELYIGTSRAVAYLHILINQDVFERISQLKD